MSSNIRNFSIVAHIDHGKSTLADRIIEYLQTLPKKDMRQQVLDTLELERERGITIKSKTIKLNYKDYILNLIDTPGHMDFTFEVSRALLASDGVILLVDASQGVEAQTIAHTQTSKKLNLKIIPVINKIDLQRANIEETKSQIKNILGIEEDVTLVSAKEGIGIEELVERITKEIPPPKLNDFQFTTGLIFDSFYDPYRGVVIFTKLTSGELKPGDKITILSNGTTYTVEEVGELKLKLIKKEKIVQGDIGYFIAGIKNIHSVKIGDYFYTGDVKPDIKPNIQETKHFVFADVFPLNQSDYKNLKSAIEKLHLVDASFLYSNTYSSNFGVGFHCGFLGLLHLDIFKERIKREYNIDIILTMPSVMYKVVKKNNEEVFIDNPSKLSHYSEISKTLEPYIKATIVTPIQYLNGVIEKCKEFRAEDIIVRQTTPSKVIINCEMPFQEIMVNFYDELKSVSKGYASFDYEFSGYKESDLVKLEVLIKGNLIDSLSFITHQTKAYDKAKRIAQKLKELIPRHLFEVPIQIKANGKIIAREDIKALRKDVIAKCYGGDVTRKLKLLQRQKEGKKKMKQFGEVNIPPEVFSELLRLK